MTMRVRTATGLQTIGTPRVRTASGLAAVAVGRVRTAGGLQTFFTSGGGGSLSAFALPDYVSGARSVVASVSVTTEPTTVYATGGTPPYSYSWVKQSGAGTWFASTPSQATTNFTRNSVPQGLSGFASVWRCTVTDSLGATATVDVDAYVINYGNA